MPLYEYECDTCRHRFEIIQKNADPTVETCPSCGGVVHKLQSAPAFQFKGTGWYVTDYAKKDQSGETKAESESKDGKPAEKRDRAGEKSDRAAEKSDRAAETTKSTTSTDAATSTPAAPASSPTTKSTERN